MADFSSNLWLSEPAYQVMETLAEEKYPLETGGMLIGYEADNGEAVVTTLIGPGPKSKHSRWKFTPDSRYQQEQLEMIFHASQGIQTYLGDWHTHPNGSSNLSRMDQRTLDRIARTTTSGTANPVMSILSGKPSSWDLGAVRYLGTQRRILHRVYDLLPLSVVITDTVTWSHL